MAKVAIIDYGVGNVRSVQNAVERIGVTPYVVSDGNALLELEANYILLPGVGAVGQALDNLRVRGFEVTLNHLVLQNKTPFCGICVGMQILSETCEEFGTHQGFGWIPGRVERLHSFGSHIKLPHVGWNTLEVSDGNDPVLGGMNGKDVYFAHSFCLKCPGDFVLSKTCYGERFVSSVRRDNILGVQFHPEKSSTVGHDFLRSFILNQKKLDVKSV